MRMNAYREPIADCPRCGTSETKDVHVHRHRDERFALQFPVILVDSVVDRRCRRCDRLVERFHPEGGSADWAIARERIRLPYKLAESDVRFVQSLVPSHALPGERALSVEEDRALRLALVRASDIPVGGVLHTTVLGMIIRPAWSTTEDPVIEARPGPGPALLRAVG